MPCSFVSYLSYEEIKTQGGLLCTLVHTLFTMVRQCPCFSHNYATSQSEQQPSSLHSPSAQPQHQEPHASLWNIPLSRRLSLPMSSCHTSNYRIMGWFGLEVTLEII